LRFVFEAEPAPSRVETLFRQRPLLVRHQRSLSGLRLVDRRRGWRWRLLCAGARDDQARQQSHEEQGPLHR
jgi:hypothetical protein